MIIEQMRKEHEAFWEKHQRDVERLIDFSRRVDELEQQLLQLENEASEKRRIPRHSEVPPKSTY